MPKDLIFADFSGGLNNQLEPWLLPPTGATELTADTNSYGLRPFSDKGVATAPGYPELENQTGSRSIVRFGNDYYWSDNDTGELGSTLGFFGIDPPATSFRVTPGSVGERFLGIYRYFVCFATDSGFRSAPNTPGNDTLGFSEVNATLQDTIVLNIDNSPPFEFNKILIKRYYGYNAGEIVSFESRVWKAKTTIAFRAATIPETHWPGRTANKWEDVTAFSISVSGYSAIELTGIPASGQKNVTTVQIWRTVAGGADFYLVDEIDNGESNYTDIKGDAELVLGELLENTLSYAPIYTSRGGTWTKVGGKYLTEVNEIFHLAYGNTLYQSNQSNPHLFNPQHSLSFDADITGLAKFLDGVIVFLGDGNPYFVRGSIQIGDVSKQLLPTNQGCLNWRTISYAGNVPIWKSAEGIATATQTRDEGIQVNLITQGRYVFTADPSFALSHRDVYYLFFDDAECVCFDLRRNKIYTRDLTADYGFRSPVDGSLYLVKGTATYMLDSGSGQQVVYASPEIGFGDITSLKKVDRIIIAATGTVDLQVYYDDVERVNTTVKVEGTRSVPVPGVEFYLLKVRLTSESAIRYYSIRYDMVA